VRAVVAYLDPERLPAVLGDDAHNLEVAVLSIGLLEDSASRKKRAAGPRWRPRRPPSTIASVGCCAQTPRGTRRWYQTSAQNRHACAQRTSVCTASCASRRGASDALILR
jgi:hypothetical protein